MTLGLIDVIGIFTFIQLSLLAVVAYRYNKGRALSNRLLASFMASNALLIAQFLIGRAGWGLHNRTLILMSTGNSMYFLMMPLLFLYLRSLCYKDFRLRLAHLLHALPCVFVTLLFCVSVSVGEEGIPAMHVSRAGIGAFEFWSHKLIFNIQVLSYIVASVLLLSAYRKQIKNLYSSVESIDLSWCNLLLAGFATMWLIDFAAWVLGLLGWNREPLSSSLIVASLLVNLALTLAVAYKGLLQGGSFSGILTPPKYASSTLQAEECGSLLDRLAKCMSDERPYLKPSLTIDELARKLDVSAKHLSQAIHTRLDQSFYDFINARRIADAKERLQQDTDRSQTILAVAYDVGFNSKSVFNAAFKKHAGMTPKEFRRRRREPFPAESPVAEQSD